MSDPQQDLVACPHCGRPHPWTVANATRRLTCACGRSLLMPATSAGRAIAVSDADDDFELESEDSQATVREQPERDGPAAAKPAASATGEDLYTLASDDEAEAAAPQSNTPPAGQLPPLPRRSAASADRCPSCNTSLKRGAVVCINCGYHIHVGMLIETAHDPADPDRPPGEEDKPLSAVAKALADRVDDVSVHDVRDYYVPLFLIGVAVVWRLIFETLWPQGNGFTSFASRTAMDMVLTLPIALVALMGLATFFKEEFGTLGSAALKLSAIVLLPAIVIDLLASLIGPITMGFPGIILTVSLLGGLYLIMFMSLFLMDVTEAIAATVVFAAIHYVLHPLLFHVVLVPYVLPYLRIP